MACELMGGAGHQRLAVCIRPWRAPAHGGQLPWKLRGNVVGFMHQCVQSLLDVACHVGVWPGLALHESGGRTCRRGLHMVLCVAAGTWCFAALGGQARALGFAPSLAHPR